MKTKLIESGLAILVIPSVICGLFWLGGFNFNERGGAAILCAFFSLTITFYVVCGIFGISTEEEK